MSTSNLSANTETLGTTIADNEYNQSAGVNTSTTVNVCNSSGGNYYYLSGTGTLNTQFLNIGVSGVGTFNQTGGACYAAEYGDGYTALGTNTNSSGNYTLTGGTFSTLDLVVGISGFGQFIQSAGTSTITNSGSGLVVLGGAAGGTGIYTLSGTGNLMADSILVGDGGTGTLTVSNGTFYSSVTVGQTSTGTFTLTGGTATIPDLVVGGGTGTGVANLQSNITAYSSALVGIGGTINLSASWSVVLGMTGGTFNLLPGGSLSVQIAINGGTFNTNNSNTTLIQSGAVLQVAGTNAIPATSIVTVNSGGSKPSCVMTTKPRQSRGLMDRCGPVR